MIECINLFIESTAKEIEYMKTACEDKNWQEVRTSAHKIKSSCNAMLSLEYRTTLDLIEEYASSEKHFPFLMRLITEFQNESALAYKELEEEKKKLEAS